MTLLRVSAVSLVMLLAACAGSTGPSPGLEGGAAPVPGPRTTPAGWAVSIVGTPFVVGFKSVVCVASLVVAAPIAGLLALDPEPYGEGLETLGDGIASNCGPPWVIAPSAAS